MLYAVSYVCDVYCQLQSSQGDRYDKTGINWRTVKAVIVIDCRSAE
jgi:hypothetical protein